MHRNNSENELTEDAENPMKSRQHLIYRYEKTIITFPVCHSGKRRNPRKKQEKINQLQKELYDCYCDIYNLLEIEKNYMEDAELTKIKTRENRRLSNRAKPSNVVRRISELEKVNSK